MHTYEEDSAPLFIAKETQKIWKSQLDSFSIQKKISKSGRIRLSVDRAVDRSNPRAKPCQLVDRAVDRPSAAVDRAIDRYCLCTLVHTGRPARSTVNCCRSHIVFIFGSDGCWSLSYLSLPTYRTCLNCLFYAYAYFSLDEFFGSWFKI